MTSIMNLDIQRLFKNLGEEFLRSETVKPRRIHVEFYPYSTLKNTIRRRGDRIIIRISDMLEDAPREVIRALGIILLCKLEKKGVPKRETKLYRDHVSSQEMQARIRKNRQKRGKKVILGPKGANYDLEESFERVNITYFSGELEKPSLTWSRGKTKTRFGHHDEALNTIVVSRTLDDRKLPVYLLDYIMYHEALHMKHKMFYKNGRRHMHTKSFKTDEKMFTDYEKARELLKKLSGGAQITD